jgi:hypothetical protein
MPIVAKTMTATNSFTGSGHDVARSLLVAWNAGDLPVLRDELHQIAVKDCSALPAFEQERFEVIQEAAQTIRVWLGGARKKHADLNVALGLLRHLAALEEAAA